MWNEMKGRKKERNGKEEANWDWHWLIGRLLFIVGCFDKIGHLKKVWKRRGIEIVEKGKGERERRKKNTWNLKPLRVCAYVGDMEDVWNWESLTNLLCVLWKEKKTKAGNWTERDFRLLLKKKKKEDRETEEIRDKREKEKKNNYWIIVWEKNFDKIDNTKNLSFDRVVR